MKINVLYLFWVLFLGIAIFLYTSFKKTSLTTIFGMAETEGQIVNFKHPAVIQQIFVKSGSLIEIGDTLIVLQRPELNNATLRRDNEIQVTAAEEQARVKELELQIQKLRSDFILKSNDIRTQIKLLKKEEKDQAALRKVVDNNQRATQSLLSEKIGTLKDLLNLEKQRFKLEFDELTKVKKAAQGVYDTRKNSVNQEIDLLTTEKEQLVLLAPISGYVENIFVGENQIVPQYEQLVKINPRKPNKVIGFLPESVEVAYQLGDTVDLISSSRSTIRTKGVLIGSNQQVVALPNRLRKEPTMNLWGRELFIHLPADNQFFIGEKLIIRMKENANLK